MMIVCIKWRWTVFRIQSLQLLLPSEILCVIFWKFCEIKVVYRLSGQHWQLLVLMWCFQGQQQSDLFIQDFIITQLIGKDILELCSINNPMGLLVETLQRLGQPEPEPRYNSAVVLCVCVCGVYKHLLSYDLLSLEQSVSLKFVDSK